jgi:transposase
MRARRSRGPAAAGRDDSTRGALTANSAGAGAGASAARALASFQPRSAVCQGKLVKLGEDVTETLEVIPRQWKVIQTVREKFTCRSCEKIAQPPAPFHPIARGRAGAGLLAMVLYAKYGNHLPLNRQSEGFAREGIDLDVSTLADWVGACVAALSPLVELIRRHVLDAARIHGDDTTVPVLAKGKTVIGRLWTYVRDDRPFGGPDPPAAVYFYSRNRDGEHPRRHLADYGGVLQATPTPAVPA